MLISGKRSIPDMKTGLVVEGGGMKCAYSAGILDRFLDEHITFDYCIGVSAGSANTASYLAGQRGRNLRFYVDHLNEPGYMGVKNLLRTGQFFGLQYIYQTLTNSDGADPIDYPAIVENPAEFELVATDAATGKPVYFTLDLDVLDPSVFPGTGTPEPGGISFEELRRAVTQICSAARIVGCDVNELSPALDASGASTAVACKIVREMLLALLGNPKIK